MKEKILKFSALGLAVFSCVLSAKTLKKSSGTF